MIHEMSLAPTPKAALAAYDQFISSYQIKFPKACESLHKDKEVLFTFYDFPAQHWPHLRTTNPIESTFATVRLRTHRPGSRFTDRDPDDGLQTRSGGPKALAPAAGIRTDSKGRYWRRFVDGEEQSQQAA